MTKEEIRVLALEEALNKARKEHDEAVNAIMQGKGHGRFGNEYDAKEIELRHEIERLEKEYREAKSLVGAISDEEAESIAESIVRGASGKSDELSEGEQEFLDMLAANL